MRSSRAVQADNEAAPVPILPSVEVLVAFLDHYGFDYFFENTLRSINIKSRRYADAVDEALDRYRASDDLDNFSLKSAFRSVVADLQDEQHCTYKEALEILSEEDYVVPVTTALYYSVGAGDADIEYLSTLIRNRAARLLRMMPEDQSED